MRDWAAYVRERLRLEDLKPERAAEIVGEIAGLLEEAYREALARGLDEAEAEAAAAAHITDWAALGTAVRESPAARIPALDRLAERAAENHRARRGLLAFVAGIWRDALYGLRLLARNRGFAAAAILTMAIGIGANTAIFSIIDSTLFFPLPYPNPNRIVFVTVAMPHLGFLGGTTLVFDKQFADWEKGNHSLEAIAAYDTSAQMTLTGAGAAERIHATRVTSGMFRVLGVYPALGRTLTAGDEQPSAPPVAILSAGLWRDRFGTNRSIIGKTVTLDGRPYAVVGIMPVGFEFPDAGSPDLLVPFPLSSSPVGNRAVRFVRVLGRLKAGTPLERARADLEVIRQRTVAGFPAQSSRLFAGSYTIVTRLHDRLVGPIRPALLALWGAVGFLLLIACVNVTNLALARALAREKEIALRVALGAHRRRVLRQLFTESVLLALLGGLAGIGIAYAIVVLVRNLGPADIPRLRQAALDLPVLGFTVAVAALAGVLAGLAPARAAWRLSMVEALKEGGRTSASRGHRRLRGALVVAEIAMALVLAIASGLLLRSFLKITALDLGFDPHNVLTAQVALPMAQYASKAVRLQFFESLLARVKAIPGVESASGSNVLPMAGLSEAANVEVQGEPEKRQARAPGGAVAIISVGPGYFRSMRIRVIAGREFEASDSRSGAPVAIVNQAFASRYLPAGNPIGRRIRWDTDIGWATVVGVSANVRQLGLLNVPMPTAYFPCALEPPVFVSLELRTRGDPLALVPALRAQVEELDPDLPVYDVATMEERLGKMEAERRFEMLALGAFALVALGLAVLGVYGVISYSVAERRHEIGIRLALGAEKGSVMRMVVGQTLVLALVGVGIGIGGALALTRYLQSLLYDIRPDDPWTFAFAAAVLIAAALLASLGPARRAMAVDPITALRYE